MAIPVRVVVATKRDQQQLVDLHLRAHQLWSPRDSELAIADVSDDYEGPLREAAEGHNGLLCFLHDDTIPGQFWFKDMKMNYDTALQECRVGLLGARVDAIPGPQAIASGIPFNQLTPFRHISLVAAVIHTEEFAAVETFKDDIALSEALLENGCTNLIGNWYMRHFDVKEPDGGIAEEEG